MYIFLAVFSYFFLFSSYVTTAAAYRGDSSIFDYVVAGMLSGSVFKVNYGLRGIIVGGTVGM